MVTEWFCDQAQCMENVLALFVTDTEAPEIFLMPFEDLTITGGSSIAQCVCAYESRDADGVAFEASF